MNKIYILFYFLLFTLNHTIAQNVIAKPIPFFFSLTSNEIWNFSQSDAGYIWVATTDGIAMYDGNRLTTFRNDYRHPYLLTDNNTTTIVDGGKYLWIGSRKGLTLFDNKKRKFIKSENPQLKTLNINEIKIQEDNVWISSNNGLLYLCNKNGILKTVFNFSKLLKLNGVSIACIYIDHDGVLWVLAGRNLLLYYDQSKGKFIRFPKAPNINYFMMYQDNHNRYWIGTSGNGLYEFKPKAKDGIYFKKHPIVNSKSGKEDVSFFSIMQDDVYGFLWILSYNELYACRIEKNGSLKPVDISKIVDTHKMYTRIFKDREGNLWLSSYDMAYLISFDPANITNYPLWQISKDFGWDANVLDMCLDDNNNFIWFCQDRFGLCHYDIANDKIKYQNQGSNSNVILEKSYDKNSIWVNIYYSPVINKYISNGNSLKITESYNISSVDEQYGSIRQILEDAKGILWVKSSNSIYACTHGKINMLRNKDYTINYLSKDKNGIVWGLSNNGNVWNLGNGTNACAKIIARNNSLSKDESIDLACIDVKGRVWIVSSLRRLFHSNSNKKELSTIDVGDLLDDCFPLNLLADKDNLWIVTNKKVIKYNCEKNTYQIFSTNHENIQVNIFRNHAAALDGNGGLYVGGHNGFIHIPSSVDDVPIQWDYYPVISDVTVNGKSIIFYNKNNCLSHVQLGPDDRNIEIFISLLKYGQGYTPRIAYQLEGVDKDWIYLSPNKYSAFYNKLDKGTYKMFIKYEYSPGKWSERQMMLTISQKPSWYESWYAELMYVCIFIGIIFFLYTTSFERKHLKERINELLNKNLRHQAVMLKTVSADVHIKDEDADFIKRLSIDVEQHISESEYDLSALSVHLGMSKSTLNRRIKSVTGMTPLDFIRNIKIKQACQLLITTKLPISEIAYNVGFSNPKYFTKCFKDETGMTPSDYLKTKCHKDIK
jgi:ligand-binding sensor domain-containing protein/AraC-like DNA-binding protein